MCGIAGILGAEPSRRDEVEAMVHALAHRGPDASGVWHAPEVTLGHTRLAIVDLTAAGSQPMVSASGRCAITFNGEIYNWRDLRDELERDGVRFRSRTDTEVLLELYERHGIGMLDRLEGMFAFAIWDARSHSLHLARDRFGKKPLYHSRIGGAFRFASEPRCFPQTGPVDDQALAWYLAANYVPAPLTIWSQVRQLPPGHRMEIRPDGRDADPVAWYDPIRAAETGPAGDDRRDALVSTLEDSVRLRLQADVPVGVFLSGGLDSSIVAAIASRVHRSVRTLTVGYEDAPELDERAAAAATARALGTDHREILITASEAQRAVIDVLDRIDEPFADDSLVPSYVLSAAARREVTVVLTGDGGDELFGGYAKYLGERWARIPGARSAARALGPALAWLPTGRTTALANTARMLGRLHDACTSRSLLERERRLIGSSPDDLVRALAVRRLPGADPVTGRLAATLQRTADWDDPVARVLMTDVLHVLPDDMLTKVDRASMWNSLEARSPFLDSRILPLAFSFRGREHVGYRSTKRLLRSVFAPLLPAGTASRGKRGFGIPIGDWLRGPLRRLLDERLDPVAIKQTGLLDPHTVARLTDEHLHGRRDRSWELWNAIVLQNWASRYLG